MLAAGRAENSHAEVMVPMRGYPDLGVLPELPARLFLVTSGFRRLQESKVRALGVESLFERIYIDAIDEADRKGKEGIFAEILRTRAFEPREVLVVGDDPNRRSRPGIGWAFPRCRYSEREYPALRMRLIISNRSRSSMRS